MRIAFDYQAFGWQEYGGISRYAFELANEMTSLDKHDVRIIAPLYINRYIKQSTGLVRVIGLPVPRLPKTGRIYQAVNKALSGLLLAYFSPDIVHETYYAVRRLAPKKCKTILTVYDMIHERFPDSFPVTDITSHSKAAAVANADHIICISKQTQRDLIELLGVDPNKTSVVYLGFMQSNVQPVECEAIKGRPYLLYVGNRGGYKNFERVLRAIASSSILKSQYRLICFGGGPFVKAEQTLTESLGFEEGDVIQVSGADNMLAALYKNATVFIYPSLYEGFGIPPLEAMGFDCPVACSNVSSIPEVVGGAGLYFDPFNIDEIKEAIERLVSDFHLRQQLISAGRERVKLFSWPHCAAETLDIYKRVLECGQ